MDFDVGQKVECLRDNWNSKHEREAWPTVGNVYVIRSTFQYSSGLGLRLEGVLNVPFYVPGFGPHEPSFIVIDHDGAPNFRPIVVRKTSIANLEALLITSGRKLETVE